MARVCAFVLGFGAVLIGLSGEILIAGVGRIQKPEGTLEDPIVDSAMTEAMALDGLSPDCPDSIRRSQRLIDLRYYGEDGKVHRGQIVVHADLADDIRHAFEVALRGRFPIRSAIPVSHPRFRKDGKWDDDLSMESNNTSAFNYRPITGGKKLSNHSYGRAIDINPALNPYVKGNTVLPRGAKYDPAVPGTLTRGHPVARALLERGWEWGGDWETLKDYQHFEKPSPENRQ
jgi:hypothetical protein